MRTRLLGLVLAVAMVGSACGSASSGEGAEATAAELEAAIAEFQERPSSELGADVAALMGDTGQVRWVPWLLDLLRLGGSSRIDAAAAEAMGRLTGIEPAGWRVDDMRNYGGWMYTNAVDGGPGYRDWKLGFYRRLDPELGDLLAQIDDDVELSRVQFGGVLRGGIPEINQPEHLPLAAADWAVPDELVLGGEVDDTAVAYPVRILGHHELVNDVVAGRPVALAYCTLCRTATFFDRRVGDTVLEFETSGLLSNSNKVMVDRQTDTLWNQITGEAMAGELVGTTLIKLPVVTSTWADWAATHPESVTIGFPEPIFHDDPERAPIAYDYTPGAAYTSYYASDDVWFPVFDTPDAFPLKTDVATIALDDAHLAVELGALADAGPQVLAVGERAVVAVPVADGTGARFYDAGDDLDPGTGVEPAAVQPDVEVLELVDGKRLARVLSGQSFWFAWYGQHQDTDWWPRT